MKCQSLVKKTPTPRAPKNKFGTPLQTKAALNRGGLFLCHTSLSSRGVRYTAMPVMYATRDTTGASQWTHEDDSLAQLGRLS